MLGCRLACSRIDNKQSYILKGPLFTADKLNVNGEGVPSTELERLQKALIGAPVRYCTNGIEIDGVPKEHYCGLINSPNSVAQVEDVYVEKDKNGRDILYASAKLKEGVDGSLLPDGWSLLADYAVKDENGFCYGLESPRIDLTPTPAYEEARHKMYAASAQAGNLNINTNPNIGESKDGANMPENNADTNSTQPANGQTVPTPAETAPVKQEQSKPETPQPKDTFTKDEVTQMLAQITKKFDDEKSKLKDETIAETKLSIQKEGRVNELLEHAEKLGVITPEQKADKFAQYMRLDKDTFAVVYDDMMAVTAKAQEAISKRPDTRYQDAHLRGTSRNKEQEDGIKDVLKRFGYSDEEAAKAYESTKNLL